MSPLAGIVFIMPNPASRHRAGHTGSVPVKRESSLESDVSQSRARVTKKLKITVPSNNTRVARVYISRHEVRSESKTVSPGSTSTSLSRASRGEGRSQFSTISTSNAPSKSAPCPASEETALSGDDADDEIDTQSERSLRGGRSSYQPLDVDDNSDVMTEVDEDEDDTRNVEMSIVQHVPLSSPPSSLPATPTSFPSLPSFPRFGPAVAVPAVPASHLVEIEDMLLTPRQGAPWVDSSSSENSTDDHDFGVSSQQRKRKRKAAAIREDSVSGIEEAVSI